MTRWLGATVLLMMIAPGCDAGGDDAPGDQAIDTANGAVGIEPGAGDRELSSDPFTQTRRRTLRTFDRVGEPPPPPPPDDDQPTPPPPPENDDDQPPPTPLDTQLRGIIAQRGLTGDPTTGRELPSIDEPLAQLGMRLFFSTSLSGHFDVACASCHHPGLAGADGLSLSIGTGAVDPAVLGPGRRFSGGAPIVGRNAPTAFNAGIWDSGLFWDSRVESLGKEPRQNGAASFIRTPDSAFGTADPDAGDNLPAAQSRFPVTVPGEMLGDGFLVGQDNDAIRSHLAARLGGYGVGAGELPSGAAAAWVDAFRAVWGDDETPAELVTEARIADAIGAYERSLVFVDTPWRRYVQGDNAALSDQAKRGAVAFLLPENQGGRGCAGCHQGDRFSDERHHTIGFPQIGPGAGDGPAGDDDHGRARQTGQDPDRWAFRTPSLLNVARTAPYGHAGSYTDLRQVLQHYSNPERRARAYVDNAEWCRQPQYAALPNCAALFPNAAANTDRALDKVARERQNGQSRLPRQPIPLEVEADIIAFLQALTDPCVDDAQCRGRFVPPADGGPDGQQLNGTLTTAPPPPAGGGTPPPPPPPPG